MSRIVLNDLTFEAKSGDQLENVSMELASPQMIAICSNDQGATTALEQLVIGNGKILDGSIMINDQNVKDLRHHHGTNIIASLAMIELRGHKVEKVIKRALRRQANALSLKATLQMAQSLDIHADDRVATLTAIQRQELKLIILLALRRPIVMLEDGLDYLIR